MSRRTLKRETEVGAVEQHAEVKAESTSAFPVPEPSVLAGPPPVKSKSELNVKIPAILLEGDEPVVPKGTTGGVGVGQEPVRAPHLPEASGSGRLFLIARDPHCVYAHWDFTEEQLRHYNQLSAERRLVLRIYREPRDGRQAAEIHLHAESRHWFAHVERAGTGYVAELGYYTPGGQWHGLAQSERVVTPPEAPAAEPSEPRFATFQAEPQRGRAEGGKREAREGTEHWAATAQTQIPVEPFVEGRPKHIPVGPALEGNGRVSSGPGAESRSWTAAQEEALAELIGLTIIRQQWPGSAEILELIRQQPQRPISSAEAAQLGLPERLPVEAISSPPGAVSSPGGAMPEQKGFWFNVNAELIIYGATEPDAQVTIGGRPIRLRRDGSFSYRFALPDGDYNLRISAKATHGDTRQAELKFYRGTKYEGKVEAHPQDPALRVPAAENV